MPSYVNWVNPGTSDFESGELFRVNSCGVRLEGHEGESALNINRPQGRRDYQLIYIWSGQAKYLLGGRERVLGDGTLILYRPGEPQIYSYRAENRCMVSWMHFTGTLAEPLLKKCGLADQPVARIGKLDEVNRLLLRIIRELQRREPQCEDQCTAYFIELTTLIGRRLRQMADNSLYEREMRIRSVMQFLHDHYDEHLTVDDLAQRCALSRHHFMHVFTQYAGVPPYAYLTELRLVEASRLLGTTALSVADVARLTGYTDALYFSHLFRKKFGLPPTQYRRQMQEDV